MYLCQVGNHYNYSGVFKKIVCVSYEGGTSKFAEQFRGNIITKTKFYSKLLFIIIQNYYR